MTPRVPPCLPAHTVALALALALAVALAACGADPPGQAPEPDLPATVPAASPPIGEPEPGEPAPRRRPRRPPPRAGVSPDPRPPQGPVPPAPAMRPLLLAEACCSEPRRGRQVDAIVLHTTEIAERRGFDDLFRLATFLARVRRSAHVVNDADGLSARMVLDERIAYHSTYWNVSTVGLEQMGFAAFTGADWRARAVQLENSARWIAHWAGRHRIPIRRCEVTGLRYNRTKRVVAGTIVRRGVCSHAQLDPRNRHDPGAAYPWESVLRRARAIVAQAG